MNENPNCPIWYTRVDAKGLNAGAYYVDSPRAGGRYRITREAEVNLRTNDELEKARLTSWLVKQRQLGEEWPLVTAEVVENAIRRPGLSVHERADGLLRCIASELSAIADVFHVRRNAVDSETQRRMAWSECIQVEELNYLMDYLESQKWVTGCDSDRPNTYQISVEGYSRIAELEQITVESSKAFVAMWFHESTNDVWETAIQPGIENAGYEPDRIDRKEHLNKIDDEIIAGLRRARFVVADFTHGDDGARGGVYYEAGFAHGRNIPVIFTCRKDVFEKVHFDTRQYNHIVWEGEKLNEFRSKLTQRICAVIGDGPRKQ